MEKKQHYKLLNSVKVAEERSRVLTNDVIQLRRHVKDKDD